VLLRETDRETETEREGEGEREKALGAVTPRALATVWRLVVFLWHLGGGTKAQGEVTRFRDRHDAVTGTMP
jgi:hypothetical protein